MICAAAVAGTVAGLGGLSSESLFILPHQIFMSDAVIHVGPWRYFVQTDGTLAVECRGNAQIRKGLQPCVVLEALFPAVKVAAALVGLTMTGARRRSPLANTPSRKLVVLS